MSNSQDIEAKLCDYIEGELSESDRAEISRHLDAHPEHRQMIEELMRTRNLVRDLPRAKAPPELNEALHGQLERSMLLGDGLSVSMAGPRRRFSHMAVLAAALFLAVGLAAAIYGVLRATSNRTQFVLTASQPDMTPANVVARQMMNGPTTLPAVEEIKSISNQKLLSELSAVAVNTNKLSAPVAQPTTQPTAVAQTMDLQLESPPASTVNHQAGPALGRIYVKVSATDPAAASEALDRFLSASGVAYERVLPGASTQPSGGMAATTMPADAVVSLDANGFAPTVLVRNVDRQKATDLETDFAKKNPTLELLTMRPAVGAGSGGFGGGGFAGNGPTTRTILSAMVPRNQGATRLADAAGAAGPTTQVSLPATQPTDDRVDMMIVVNTIQPAAMPPSTRPLGAIEPMAAEAEPTTKPVVRPAVAGYSNSVNESSGNDRK